ncbi:MAG: HAD-IIIA family hydrolase [Bacteroidota bacterium]
MTKQLKPDIPQLKENERKKRANQIQLLLSDCDGVLTDNGVYYSNRGEEMKRFSIRDGMAVALLQTAGIETGIISGEKSKSLQQRAEKLHISHVYLGVTDKLQQLKDIASRYIIPLNAVAYIGDDVNDAGIMSALQKISLTAAPGDAVPSVLSMAHYICTAVGGHGAFREFSDWILNLRSKDIHS